MLSCHQAYYTLTTLRVTIVKAHLELMIEICNFLFLSTDYDFSVLKPFGYCQLCVQDKTHRKRKGILDWSNLNFVFVWCPTLTSSSNPYLYKVYLCRGSLKILINICHPKKYILCTYIAPVPKFLELRVAESFSITCQASCWKFLGGICVKEIVDIIQSASTTCNTKRMVLVRKWQAQTFGILFSFMYNVGMCYLSLWEIF